jgi:hypothetical protein
MYLGRARRFGACVAALCAAIALDRPAHAQGRGAPGGLGDIAVPDGFAYVLGSGGATPSPIRGHDLADFIRRTYNSPGGSLPDPDAARPIRLAGPHGSVAMLPLPLPPAIWTDVVFGGRETPETLLPAILRSRGPALFYYGLLSLDDDTRAWLATQPQLVAELAGRRAAAFVVAAPGLRVRGATLDVPGGPAAAPAWRVLAGHSPDDPAGFVRALLAQDQGRLAFFFGTMAQLTPGQMRVAWRLEAPDPDVRVDAARRLRAVFDRVTLGWRVDDSVFSRPALDPALLIASLRHDDQGMPVVPGTHRFWTAVLADGHRSGAGDARRAAPAEAGPVDFAWLCEQIFASRAGAPQARYRQVLFASRLEARGALGPGPHAIEAVRAVRTVPALVLSLERAGLADVAAFAAAARRAERIAAIRNPHAASRSLAQFQGALALVTRVASRGGMPPDALKTTIASLSHVETGAAGGYDGRVVRWLDDWLAAHLRHAGIALDIEAAGPVERDALAALAGPAVAEPRFVDWEGTRYRLDFAAAEGHRLARLLGRRPRPFLSSARELVEMADAIDRDRMHPERLRQHASTLDAIARSVGWHTAHGWEGSDVPRRYGDARAALPHAVAGPPAAGTSPAVPLLLELADALAARGLMELAYAVALGHPDRPAISADEAARRHAFSRPFPWRRPVAWEFPLRGTSPERGWHVTGSLLGLDVQLADFGLVRLSLKPPARKPSVPDEERRVLTETVALVDAASLADDGHAAIVSAIRRGRARLAAARTSDEVLGLADEIRMSPARRTLLAWAIARERADPATRLAPSELLWLGLERAPVPETLHRWGAPAGPRTGCLCLEMLDRQPWEILAGRRFSGAVSSGFSDLNLRLAELLDELRMPPPLLAAVLAAATLDLIEHAVARDQDDRQALLDFVHALRPERVEAYLALLTTDGPLVPVAAAVTTGAAR